ncbi:hypothetical protein F4778DRAFT_229207 [Xylariomycetidae sp. FL2044]|nr:hypothetical protein F4778DRAFT_229207 [Xylariomycetidae sp. FL2044]
MAFKRVAMLALATAALAQMENMDPMMSSEETAMATTAMATTAAPTSEAISTSVYTDSPIGLTNPASTVADTTVPTAMASDVMSSAASAVSPADDYMGQTTSMPMESAMSSAAAATSGMSSMTTVTGSAGSMGGMPMGTGHGMGNATMTGAPVPGSGAMTGVSIGIFVVSVALTAMIQL